jgi:hypothetical protein
MFCLQPTVNIEDSSHYIYAYPASSGPAFAGAPVLPGMINIWCSAVQCSAVQCSAVQCSAVQCSAVLSAPAVHGAVIFETHLWERASPRPRHGPHPDPRLSLHPDPRPDPRPDHQEEEAVLPLASPGPRPDWRGAAQVQGPGGLGARPGQGR